MSRQIQLSFPEFNVSCEAALFNDRAPKTCAAVWNSLPVEGSTVHGRWSGPEIFIGAEELQDVEQENGIHKPEPGDICYWMCPGGKYASVPERAVELILIYDTGAALCGPEGLPAFANLFARVEGDWEAFRSAARAVRTEGARVLRIERVNER